MTLEPCQPHSRCPIYLLCDYIHTHALRLRITMCFLTTTQCEASNVFYNHFCYLPCHLLLCLSKMHCISTLNIIIPIINVSNLIFVWLCIISNDGKEESHLDATLMVIDKSKLVRHVLDNNFAHLQEH